MTDDPPGAVLDASVLLAYLQREAGSETVEAALARGAAINVVNYAEVLSRLGDAGQEPVSVHRQLHAQGLTSGLLQLVLLDRDDDVTIARLRALTRDYGLSLGDRACLAIDLRPAQPVITADRAWVAVDVGVTVPVIRP